MIPLERTRKRWGKCQAVRCPAHTGAGLAHQPHRVGVDGATQDGGFILLPASFWSLAQMKNPSCVPKDLLEKPHETRPCPILPTPAALLDQMKHPAPKPAPSLRLEPLQPPETKDLGRDRGAGLLCWFWWLGRAWQRCSTAKSELGLRELIQKTPTVFPETFTGASQQPCSGSPG